MSAPESIRIPMDMAVFLAAFIPKFGDGRHAAVIEHLSGLIAEADDPEQPHPGVETQPPLTMRLIIGETVHEADVHQMPVVGDTVICGSHYTVGAVTWHANMLVADVIAGPGIGGWGQRS